jgi:homospermidine synthase
VAVADWAKIDVGFLRHPQVVGLKPAEQLGYLAMILWSQEYETDGVVPDPAMRVIAVTDREAKAMQAAGLVSRAGHTWVIDGFTRKQRSAAELERERERARERRTRGRSVA